jgi:hypothetical protein
MDVRIKSGHDDAWRELPVSIWHSAPREHERK